MLCQNCDSSSSVERGVYMKKRRKVVSLFIAACLVVCSVVPSFAMDSRVQASKTWTNSAVITKAEADKHPNWVEGYYKAYAKGYVTAVQKHYANSELLIMGQHVKYSGRVWGTGKVTAQTDWGYSVCAIVDTPYGSNVYYDFA